MIPIKEIEIGKLRAKKNIVGAIEQKRVAKPKELDANTKAMADLVGAIKSLVEKEAPQQTPQDLTPILLAMARVQETQKNILETLSINAQPAKKHWAFTVNHPDGRTTKISAIEGQS